MPETPNRHNRGCAALLGLLTCLALAASARGQTVTGIAALYNSGETTADALVAQGSQDKSSASSPTTTSGWYVTYASTNGGSSASTTYQGDAYAISGTPSGYTSDTSSAEWIVAPGATNVNNGSPNTGGNYLPGNGTTGSNEGIYVYTLAFTITGAGAVGTQVTTPLTIDLTIAADDGGSIYVNPKGAGVDPTTAPSTYTAAAAATDLSGAWNNTTSLALANGTTGSNGNSIFYIGTNYISVVVDNTNNVSGSSTVNSTNQSGLLVYQTDAFIGSREVMANGGVVPEVTPWLPLLGAVGLYGYFLLRRPSPAGTRAETHA